MRLADFVESKDPGGLGFINAGSHFTYNGLKRDVRNRKLRSTEYKAAKKREINPAWHLKQRVEVIHWIKATEPPGKAHTPTSAQHPKRIHEGGVADQIQDRVNPSWLRNKLREIWSFILRLLSSKFFQRLKSLLL